MNYLLDTCVLSELIRKKPDQQAVRWISAIDELRLFISVLTIGELHKGIEKLPSGKKREKLLQWVNEDLRERFSGRIIDFDLQSATAWGKMQAKAETAGRALPISFAPSPRRNSRLRQENLPSCPCVRLGYRFRPHRPTARDQS